MLFKQILRLFLLNFINNNYEIINEFNEDNLTLHNLCYLLKNNINLFNSFCLKIIDFIDDSLNRHKFIYIIFNFIQKFKLFIDNLFNEFILLIRHFFIVVEVFVQ